MDPIYDEHRKQHDRNEDTLHLKHFPHIPEAGPRVATSGRHTFYLFIKVEPLLFFLKEI